jgi:uncharacterized damage-inducible protein DinB
MDCQGHRNIAAELQSALSREDIVSNRDFFVQTLAGEVDRFRSVINSLPDARMDYKPETKSRTAKELVEHLIGHFQDLIELLDHGVINHRMNVPFTTVADGVRMLDGDLQTLLSKLSAADDATWARVAEFRVGDNVIATAPTQALTWMLFLDAIHHRGQLSTYIRPMGGKCPSIYGPSADTKGNLHGGRLSVARSPLLAGRTGPFTGNPPRGGSLVRHSGSYGAHVRR